MWTPPVVVIHQVETDILHRFLQAHVSRCRELLSLQIPEQPLHRGIPSSCHVDSCSGHAIAPQPLPKRTAAILAALSGVKQHA